MSLEDDGYQRPLYGHVGTDETHKEAKEVGEKDEKNKETQEK
ncbi:uncharacterized protein G6M90_00g071490 [Metarhizium brunneum]|uniref:Uncharacterized protein n=1 Tax=Metarhizium brunneum TaxID=500148 RepID=A0A7D5Z0E9_9HYPO|nr:hypothetical protein G6M90_00g071490 [Metarhizium brunneum]